MTFNSHSGNGVTPEWEGERPSKGKGLLQEIVFGREPIFLHDLLYSDYILKDVKPG